MINHPNRTRKRREHAPETASAPIMHKPACDALWQPLLPAMQASFNEAVASGPLFQTGVATRDDEYDIYDLFLNSLPSDRQYHTCSACRHFLRRYGGLVTVADDGSLVPAMWAQVPADTFYSYAVHGLAKCVRGERITRPFYSPSAILGIPRTGEWSHLAVASAPIYISRTRTPGQEAAAKLADFETVSAALDVYSPAQIEEALRLLRSGNLLYPEKFIAPLEWLRALYERPSGQRGRNLRWRAVATAPAGYCHVRASITGTLLDDIKAKTPFPALQAKWNDKARAENYQRPVAPPSIGNIARGEKLVEQLGIARSLERRFARLDEIETIWRPAEAAPEKPAAGVFGHLSPHAPPVESERVAMPPVVMTWAKFETTVLGGAERMQFLPPAMSNRYCVYLTAQHMDAPPIIKWDRLHHRNPVSLYVYTLPVPAGQFRIRPAIWTDIMGVSRRPNLWRGNTMAHLGDGGVLLVLRDAYDTHDNAGNALFPDNILHELHEVRATIEAYSRTAKIGGREAADTTQLATGYTVGKPGSEGLIRVWSGGRYTDYRIDRWD